MAENCHRASSLVCYASQEEGFTALLSAFSSEDWIWKLQVITNPNM